MMSDRGREIAEAERLARKAVQWGKDDAVPLSRAANALAFVVHDLDAGTVFTDRALALNPNLAFGWYSSGLLRVWIGEPDTAIKHLAHFQRMSPFDPVMPLAQAANAFAHFHLDNYDEALSQTKQALQANPNVTPALRVSAAAYALAGRIQEAQKMMSRLREIDPELRVSNLKDLTPLRRPEDMARFAEGLRKAGLPE